MIKNIFFLTFFLSLVACGGVDFVLKEKNSLSIFKNNTLIETSNNSEKNFDEQLFSMFGNNKNGDFVLVTQFSEKKENRLVKINQVAEKIDYEITVKYDLYYKNRNCKIYNKQIVSNFSFVPKSDGYNFGTDRSFEKLYKESARKNILSFVNSTPKDMVCL